MTNQVDLSDLQDEVELEAGEHGCEAFGCEPWEYDSCLTDLLHDTPMEMINFLGFDSIAEYMDSKRMDDEEDLNRLAQENVSLEDRYN